jgi:hypothetical protein
MEAANDNDPLPFIQIAAMFANVMTYLSLKQLKSANNADRNEEGRNDGANAVC